MIDTGLDWHHRDISWDNIWTNPGEIPNNGVDDDRNGYVDDMIGWNFFGDDNKPWDHDGHGTFVSGIITGSWGNDGIAGINPQARIMVLKGINNFGHTRASYLAEALVYAVDNGARVINMSMGGEGTTRVELEAMRYAWSRGAVIVVAAGNSATDTADYGIASIPEALVVAATDTDDKRAVFSNWGASVDIAAPGVDVLSLRARRTDLMRDIPGVVYEPGAAYVGEDHLYYRSSGTSFAAPIVAGVASLLLTDNPRLTNEEVVRILLNSAAEAELPGVDQYTGYGIVDAKAALKADPAFFVAAGITGVEVVQSTAGPAVRVLGTADANRFGRAWFELGSGEEPRKWKRVGDPIRTRVQSSTLSQVPAREFAGSPVWQLKLVVEHGGGERREARFRLDLN